MSIKESGIKGLTTVFNDRVRTYGVEAAKETMKSLGSVPTIAEVHEAERLAHRAKYEELKATNPFAAVDYARENPIVYEEAPTTPSEPINHFKVASERLAASESATEPAAVFVVNGDAA